MLLNLRWRGVDGTGTASKARRAPRNMQSVNLAIQTLEWRALHIRYSFARSRIKLHNPFDRWINSDAKGRLIAIKFAAKIGPLGMRLSLGMRLLF
jgi:hypothetical protein